jgi:molybdopterin-containing oxidoreductase family iron-sulfur binding subunit
MNHQDTNNDPPAPGEPDWETWADEQLAAGDFDPELGKAMAADAMRVSSGELSEAAFYRRYHEAVVDEFGVDRRPSKDAEDASGTEPEPRVPDSGGDGGGPSRRSAMKLFAGTAAATIALPGCLGEGQLDSVIVGKSEDVVAETGAGNPDSSGTQMGMVIDLERCQGELDCMQACKQENNTAVGVHWNYVFRFAKNGEGPADQYMPRPCQHCTRPTCTFVCPTEARHKRDSDGIVLTDYDQCIGCRYCQVACPYGVNFFGWGEPAESDSFEYPREDKNGNTVAGNPPGGVMGKCTFCVHRQDSGDPELEGTTACAEACPWGTISFGDMNDPEGAPQQHLEEKSGVHTFHLLKNVGNEPNVIFVGPEPTSDAKSGDGTETTFEDMGFVDLRRDVINDRTGGKRRTDKDLNESANQVGGASND